MVTTLAHVQRHHHPRAHGLASSLLRDRPSVRQDGGGCDPVESAAAAAAVAEAEVVESFVCGRHHENTRCGGHHGCCDQVRVNVASVADPCPGLYRCDDFLRPFARSDLVARHHAFGCCRRPLPSVVKLLWVPLVMSPSSLPQGSRSYWKPQRSRSYWKPLPSLFRIAQTPHHCSRHPTQVQHPPPPHPTLQRR